MNRYSAIHGIWRVAASRNERAFARALEQPERAQLEVLRGLVKRNRASPFGQRHHFERIESLAAWRSRVPLSDGEDLAAQGPALLGGTSGLTTEPIRRLVPTSGSTGAVKLVAWTPGLARAFAAGIDPWIVDLMRRHPEVACGRAYWSVSPARMPAFPPATVPIGFEDDAAYLGRWMAPLVERVLLAPRQLRFARADDAFRYATLLLLLSARDLRLVSVWHPSFFSILLEARSQWWDQLIEDLHRGTLRVEDALGPVAGPAARCRVRADPERAAELARLGVHAAVCEIWPKLAVVSAWADGPAAAPATVLARQVAPAVVEPKGLLATEAMVTVPYAGQHPVALRSHFFEFRDELGICCAAHELKQGGRYEVIVSTQGGLYRYRLGDVVAVVGRVGATPSLRFVGRSDRRTDQVGEKLSDAFVRAALDSALGSEEGFVRLAASAVQPGERPSYTLVVDGSIRDPFGLRRRVLAELRRNPYFSQALDLGQLGPVRIFRVRGHAHERWLEFEAASGPIGSIKPTSLDTRIGWEALVDGEVLYERLGDN